MALKIDPDSLRQEVRSSTAYRDHFLEAQSKIITRGHGNFYRDDKRPDRHITENHAYEYLSIMLPTLVYGNPRCKITSADPNQMDDSQSVTMGDMAKGIELFLNRWSEDSLVSQPLGELAVDFLHSWMVALVTIQDQPGYQGVEMVPQQPYIIRISPRRFIMDPTATSWGPMQSGGPRYMGHMWKADQEDLLKDPKYDHKAINLMATDGDIEAYDVDRKNLDIPLRNEILAWDIWVPEIPSTDQRGYNGTIYTIAAAHTAEGIGKKTYQIREPRPCYCPPWGPYVMQGAYKVVDQVYPLSPLVATAEQAEEVNNHTTAAAESAKSFKKFAYGERTNEADAETLKHVRNGEIAIFDDTEKIGSMEIGGASESQYKYTEWARQRLNRVSGLSDAQRGEVTGGVTATESSIAESGTKARVNGLKRQFRLATSLIFKTASWYAFHGEDFIGKLGAEGERAGMSEFRGGITAGREGFNFFDMTLHIDPLSMEHTDQAMFQRRAQMAFETLTNIAPVMLNTPWVKWREPVQMLFQSLNIANADEWIDFEQLKIMQQAAMQQAMGGGEGGGEGGGLPGGGPAGLTGGIQIPRLAGDRSGIPANMTGRARIDLARETGGLNADAITGA
jgi:hypothetical protein